VIYTIIAIVVPLVELLGILTAVHAVMNPRTSQGAIAWAISLVTFPCWRWRCMLFLGATNSMVMFCCAAPKIKKFNITSIKFGPKPLIKN